MRKTIAVTAATGALLLGGAGIANADAGHGQVPASTTSTLAEEQYGNDNDNTGLWGLAGLLGLLGLLGLRHRHDHRANDIGVLPGTASSRTDSKGMPPPRP